jgi:hypothetical protein
MKKEINQEKSAFFPVRGPLPQPASLTADSRTGLIIGMVSLKL